MLYIMVVCSLALGVLFALIRANSDIFDGWSAADWLLFVAIVILFFVAFAAVLILVLIIGG